MRLHGLFKRCIFSKASKREVKRREEIVQKRAYHINTPFSEKDIEKLRSGDKALITGVIYGARDLVHKKFMESIDKGENFPIHLRGQVIYYTGMSPAPPGKVVGAVGPTSSYRMDKYAPKLMELGLKGMIGKGPRSDTVKDAIIKYKAVYMAAIGGAGALLSTTIKKARVVAYEEFGPEALMEFYVEGFPVVVVNDIYGNDLYIEGQRRYCIK